MSRPLVSMDFAQSMMGPEKDQDKPKRVYTLAYVELPGIPRIHKYQLAKKIGISRSTLRDRLRKHKENPEKFTVDDILAPCATRHQMARNNFGKRGG